MQYRQPLVSLKQEGTLWLWVIINASQHCGVHCCRQKQWRRQGIHVRASHVTHTRHKRRTAEWEFQTQHNDSNTKNQSVHLGSLPAEKVMKLIRYRACTTTSFNRPNSGTSSAGGAPRESSRATLILEKQSGRLQGGCEPRHYLKRRGSGAGRHGYKHPVTQNIFWLWFL